MKSKGGLTRGRGITKEQRAVWLLLGPACSVINEALQNLTLRYVISEQHKDATPAHKKLDTEHTMKLLEFLETHDPFTKEERLHSIISGIAADSTSNAYDAKAVSEIVLKKMEGKTASEYTFKRIE